MRKFTLYFFITLSIFSDSAWAAKGGLTKEKLLSIISHITKKQDPEELVKLEGSLKKDHPDFPSVVILRALRTELLRRPDESIPALENLLTQLQYTGAGGQGGEGAKNSKGKVELFVGTVGSFDFWRNLLYLVLGRAYYETQKPDKAVYYLGGVEKNSKFGVIARIERAWAQLKLEDFKGARATLEELKQLGSVATPNNKNEITLLRSYVDLKEKNPENAHNLASSLKISKTSTFYNIQQKVLAQSLFDIYNAKQSFLKFDDKIQYLTKILEHADLVPEAKRDASFSFLVGETYWLLASVLRVEDPEKYNKRWIAALENADNWLTPWVNRSLEENKAYVNEEALFFSVAILWEREKQKDALPRLFAIPKLFPQGQYREDAFQLLGEYHYDRGDFKEALEAYRLLADIGSPRRAAYGVYKAAWSYYNLNEKWKALRHLERLVLHYRGEAKTEAPKSGEQAKTTPAPSSGLSREGENDMLFMIAELLDGPAAIKELELFKYTSEEWIDRKERLGETYGKIGKYEQSVAIWIALLEDVKNSPQSYVWLGRLLQDTLRIGKRELLAKVLEKYVGTLPPNAPQDLIKTFQSNLVALILTVHKEAKKSEDANIWAATDALYVSFEKHFINSQNGDIWLYGAQRKEQLGLIPEAIEWYKRASNISNYEGRKDTASSVLRLTRDLADSAGGKIPATPELFQKIAAHSLWYIDNFKSTTQRTLAETLYLDALYKSGDFESSHQYILKALRGDVASQERQGQYFKFNQRLYKDKQWERAFKLASELSAPDYKSPEGKKFRKTVLGFKQETAFQMAFSLGTNPAARDWYKKSIAVGANIQTSLKAWHNLLYSYKIPEEADSFLLEIANFEKQFKLENDPNAEAKKLLFDIYSRSAFVWNARGNSLSKAVALTNASQYASDENKTDTLRWECALIYGSYYQLIKMQKEIQELKRKDSPILKSPENILLLARLLFLNGDYRNAWFTVRKIVSERDVPASAWILIVDLANETEKEKSPIFDAISEYLTQNQSTLKNIPFLEAVWARVLHKDFEKNIAFWKDIQAPKLESEGPNPFATRVKKVAATLKQHSAVKESMKDYIQSPALQVSINTICVGERIDQITLKDLRAQKEPALASHPQWNTFVKRLDQKIGEIEKMSEAAHKTCSDQNREIAYLPPVNKGLSPLCGDKTCFKKVPPKPEKIAELEISLSQKKISTLGRTREYLNVGAWAAAEYNAYSTSSIPERTLILGFLRLARGDMSNAAEFFEEAAKDPKMRSSAKLFLARIAWRNNFPRVAKSHIDAIEKANFDGEAWQKELYEEVLSDIKKD